MELKQMAYLIRLTAADSADKALSPLSPLPATIFKSQAYRSCGRTHAGRRPTGGLLTLSNQKLNRVQLEAIVAAGNRVTYLLVAER